MNGDRFINHKPVTANEYHSSSYSCQLKYNLKNFLKKGDG